MDRSSYIPIASSVPILGKAQTITDCVRNNKKINFSYVYTRGMTPKKEKCHAQPTSLFFENKYFYAVMFDLKTNKYQLYRVDHIQKIYNIEDGKQLDYSDHFSLLDHRKQTFLTSSGRAVAIKIEYSGDDVEMILDYFPSAKVLKVLPNQHVVIELYSRIDGIVMWILSQGDKVKVLSPPLLVEKIKRSLFSAIEQY